MEDVDPPTWRWDDDDVHRRGENPRGNRKWAAFHHHSRRPDADPHCGRDRAGAVESHRPCAQPRSRWDFPSHPRHRDRSVQPRLAARVRHPFRHAGYRVSTGWRTIGTGHPHPGVGCRPASCGHCGGTACRPCSFSCFWYTAPWGGTASCSCGSSRSRSA